MTPVAGTLCKCSDGYYGIVLRSFATPTGQTFTVLLGNGIKRVCFASDLEVFPMPSGGDALQGFIELLRMDQ